MMSYYELSSATMDPCTLVKSEYEEALKTWLCKGCAFPRPGATEVDVIVQEREPDDTPLNFISGCGIGIASRDFLFSLDGDVVKRELYLGQVFNIDRVLLKSWTTFIGKRRLTVRGTRSASYRVCAECGRTVYFAMGPHYLYPAPPPEGSIFDSGNGGLVVVEALARRIAPNKWRKLSCTELPVLHEPSDGLAHLPVI